ncbi:hypothetical protein [Wenjunlia tyrosinilytica]|uniref:Uncharacterized protein n=1 Tax=Wenjunlia tyrosinilytica TaxID=1544741 RepID=A0A917ZX13_9ACTN|nr:hypothetical protein [Wenjunlia tyrosinilytica]GGO98733.1 hypothetical protein GCM10012280_63560 [Wenjunlia tyrosinilytica]
MSDHETDAPQSGRKKPAKKAARAFPARKPPKTAGVFDSVIAGADQIAANAFAAGAAPADAAAAPFTLPGGESHASLPTQVAPMPPAAPGHAPGGPSVVPPAPNQTPVHVHGAAPPSTVVPEVDGDQAPQPRSGADSGRQQSQSAESAAAATREHTQPSSDSSQSASTPLARTGVAYAPRRRNTRRGEWAHQAVRESFADAKIASNTWGMHGFRILPDVLAGLKKRLARDKRSSGNTQLALGHYIDAALRHAPQNIDDQVACAQAFLAERMGFVDAGLQSTYRIGPDARAYASELNLALQEANHGRKGLYVISAVITELLRAMEAEGELQRPAPPPA